MHLYISKKFFCVLPAKQIVHIFNLVDLYTLKKYMQVYENPDSIYNRLQNINKNNKCIYEKLIIYFY